MWVVILSIFGTACAASLEDLTHLEESCALKLLKDAGKLDIPHVLPAIESFDGVDCERVLNVFYNKTFGDISTSISERYETDELTTNCVVEVMRFKGFGEFLLGVKFNHFINVSFEEIEKRGDKFLFDSMETCNGALEKLHERLLQRFVNITKEISDTSVDLCERKLIINSNITTFKSAEVVGRNFNSTVNLDDINCTEILKEILKAQKKLATQAILAEIK